MHICILLLIILIYLHAQTHIELYSIELQNVFKSFATTRVKTVMKVDLCRLYTK